MENIQVRKVLNKVVALLLMLEFSMFYSQPRPSVPGGGGLGGVGAGRPKTPIDMYEGILVGVASMLIIGYYFYSRNKRVANS